MAIGFIQRGSTGRWRLIAFDEGPSIGKPFEFMLEDESNESTPPVLSMKDVLWYPFGWKLYDYAFSTTDGQFTVEEIRPNLSNEESAVLYRITDERKPQPEAGLGNPFPRLDGDKWTEH